MKRGLDGRRKSVKSVDKTVHYYKISKICNGYFANRKCKCKCRCKCKCKNIRDAQQSFGL